MADKIGLSNEIRELKLGSSFYKKKEPPFHTVKYDFKPASVDTSQMANLEIGSSNEVCVTVPHLEGSGTPNTVFKGSKRPYAKECILIIDHKTGEITLERLGLNIQLKKTRAEGSSKVNRSMPAMDLIAGTKKLHAKQHHTQKESQKTRKVSPPRVSPTQKGSGAFSGKAQSQSSGSSRANVKPPSAPASMPQLGLGEELDSPTPIETPQLSSAAQSVGLMLTDSSSESGSSSSSDSSDSEDPDMEVVPTPAPVVPVSHTSPVKPHPPPNSLTSKSQQNFVVPVSNSSYAKPKNPPMTASSSSLLNDDLCLSESGSDSD